MHMIFLVDGDNHLSEGLQGIDLLTEEDSVFIFYGKGQSLAPIQRQCEHTRAQVQYLESVRSGKNSIDFQIITELGVLVGRGEAEFAYVISHDKGYESAIGALRQRYANTFREVGRRPSIESCLQGAFLLRPDSKAQLAQSLEKTYGQVWGRLIYQHLKAVFADHSPDRETTAASAETESAQQSSRRKKQKHVPEPEIIIEEAQVIEDEPLPPKKRTHRAGRRHKR